MPRGRRKSPSAKSDSQPGPSPRVLWRRWLPWPAAALATIVLLSLAFAPFDQWYLGYVALAGWTVMVVTGPRTRRTLLIAWAVGALYWAVTLYWLWWITLVGYFALVFYLSLYWLAAGALLRTARRRGIPMVIALPIFWVALEYARAYVISGFPWFFLAQTQYRVTELVQIASVTGQYGLSFFVAMVNGAVADTVLWWSGGKKEHAFRWRVMPAAGLCAVTAASLVVYGHLAVHAAGPAVASESATATVGIVQRAYPISLQSPGTPSEEVFDRHYRDSLELIERAAAEQHELDLLCWPETMLPGGVNAELLERDPLDLTDDEIFAFFSDVLKIPNPRGDLREIFGRFRDVRIKYEEMMTRLADLAGCPVLAGGLTYHLDPESAAPGRMWVVRNSALLFEPGLGNTGYFAKMQLVPFSEYVPFKRSLPGVHKFLRGFVPPVMTQLDSGKAPYRFAFTPSAPASVEGKEQVRFGAPICYEGTFARVCRDLVYGPDRQKKADVLVNISNDGWFVWPESREGTTEQAQHLSHYVFRAVENRVPVVRVVNTGISGVIDSNGRIQEVAGGSPENLDASVMAEATLIAGITLDTRSSLYSLVGDVFAQGVSLIAMALLIRWVAPAIRRKVKGTSDEAVS